MRKFIPILIAALTLSVGCASIVSGKSQEIKITTVPADANVVVYDKANMKVWDSTAPAAVNLKRGTGFFSGASYSVEISKVGFKTQQIKLESRLNGWYLAGNFVFGGLLGWIIVDPITGAMWTLTPKAVDAELASAVAMSPEGGNLCVVLKEDIPASVFEKLDLVALN